MYRTLTHEIEVTVTPSYEPEQSHPDQDFFFYSYQVCITNYSNRRVKLLARHWIIHDGSKGERHVHGQGVIGLQPTIDPGYAFEYASACPLNCPYGNMRGYYQMEDDDHENFKIEIPLFFLQPPKPMSHHHIATHEPPQPTLH